jgi:hypothetical protein
MSKERLVLRELPDKLLDTAFSQIILKKVYLAIIVMGGNDATKV